MRLLAAMALCALSTVGALAATAGAAPYGELKRFGKLGKTPGSFTDGSGIHALGVDPSDNSVYVGDEPKANEYRIQKFTSEGVFVASAAIKFKANERSVGLQGIAVDPALGRVYALVVYEREEEEEGGLVDPEEFAAGTLYAFSTTPSGQELVPGKNTKGEPLTGGVLADKEALHAQSEVTGKPAESALLEPSGIAVDPKTSDVIVLGQEDRGAETRLVAAQRVHSDGTLGARWVDTTECFEGEGTAACTDEDGSSVGAVPNSPIVTAGGKLLVVEPSESEIWEIPSSFTLGQAPKLVYRFGNVLQNLISFPGVPEPFEGGAMAYARESGEGENEGRLYVSANVVRTINSTPQHLPAVIELKLSESAGTLQGAEVGWTGGVSKVEREQCAINIFGTPVLGAGPGQRLYVFDSAIPSPEEELKGTTKNPHVDVFGPSGTSCPAASATAPVATLGPTVVGSEKSPIPAGQKVALSSTLTGANAISVEWNFGDGSAPVTEGVYQFEKTRVEHAFLTLGSHTVKETIHTDDLAEPTLTKEVGMVVAASAPTAQFSGPGELAPGQTATFDAKSTSDPNGKPIVKYAWNFGDGSPEVTSTSSSISHTYTTEGTFSVSLKVTDELGLTSAAAKHIITVASAIAPATTATTATPPPPPPPSSQPPGGGVLPSHEQKAAPEAKLASTALSVSAAGGVPVKVSCPAGASCTGTIVLKTIGAVSAGVSAQTSKKAILTLASGSFTIAGGSTKTLMLHLSAKARKLLAKSHTLRAKATVVARDSSGASGTSASTVTLKLAKKSAHH